jgi:hypothetical protein
VEEVKVVLTIPVASDDWNLLGGRDVVPGNDRGMVGESEDFD